LKQSPGFQIRLISQMGFARFQQTGGKAVHALRSLIDAP
jgi:hypothetical protein